jgi:ribonuclease J
MEAHARLALANGVPRVMVPINGSAIRLAPNGPKLLGHEPAGRLVLDGDVILPANGATIVERRRLMMSGYMGVTVVLGRDGRLAAAPVVNMQGVPVEEDKTSFLDECADAAAAAVKKADPKNADKLVEAIRVAVRRVAREWTGKKPVTEVQVVRLQG